MMRKLLLAIVATMMLSVTVNAQSHKYYDTRHEVGVSVGIGANTEIIGVIGDITEIIATNVVLPVLTAGWSLENQKYSYGDATYYPTISAEYYYHVNKVIGLGGFVAYNGMSRDMFVTIKNDNDNTRKTEKSGVAKRHNLSIIPTAKFDWLRKKNFGMYSKLGVGVSFLNESQKDDAAGGTDYSDTDVVFNFQCSLLGLEVGSQTIRGFAEVGVGEQGMLSAGFRYKF